MSDNQINNYDVILSFTTSLAFRTRYEKYFLIQIRSSLLADQELTALVNIDVQSNQK